MGLLAQLQTLTVTVFQITRNNPFTVFLCLNVPIFMFAHIFFLYHPELNKGGIFGYKYWSVFFASMMYPVLFFAFGYLWQRVSDLYIHDRKGRMYSRLLVTTFYFFSLFYLLITVFPYDNSYKRIGLEPIWYYAIAFISTASISIAIYNLPNDKIKRLKESIRNLISFITSQRNNVVDLMDYDVKCFEVLDKVARQ